MHIVTRWGLGVLLLAFTPWAHSDFPTFRVAEFCSSCIHEEAARQKAWTFRPAIRCDWPDGESVLAPQRDLSCRSNRLEVLLINPHNEAIHSYRLIFNPESSLHELEKWTLNADEKGAAETILEIHQTLMDFDFSSRVEVRDLELPGRHASNGQPDCPVGTVLDHVLHPGFRGWMSDAIHTDWAELSQPFRERAPRVSRSAGISAGYGSARLVVGWEHGEAPIWDVFRAVFIFDESEVETDPPLDDVIAYDIHEFDRDEYSMVMHIEFHEGLSRAVGYPVTALLSGQVVIDSACAQQKLDHYQHSRPDLDFTVGGPGGPLFDFPPLEAGMETCTRLLCARACVGERCGSCEFKVSVQTSCEV